MRLNVLTYTAMTHDVVKKSAHLPRFPHQLSESFCNEALVTYWVPRVNIRLVGVAEEQVPKSIRVQEALHGCADITGVQHVSQASLPRRAPLSLNTQSTHSLRPALYTTTKKRICSSSANIRQAMRGLSWGCEDNPTPSGWVTKDEALKP